MCVAAAEPKYDEQQTWRVTEKKEKKKLTNTLYILTRYEQSE